MFFVGNQQGQQNDVLDTRSGAVAALDVDESAVAFSNGDVFAEAGASEHHDIDAAALPAITCY